MPSTPSQPSRLRVLTRPRSTLRRAPTSKCRFHTVHRLHSRLSRALQRFAIFVSVPLIVGTLVGLWFFVWNTAATFVLRGGSRDSGALLGILALLVVGLVGLCSCYIAAGLLRVRFLVVIVAFGYRLLRNG